MTSLSSHEGDSAHKNGTTEETSETPEPVNDQKMMADAIIEETANIKRMSEKSEGPLDKISDVASVGAVPEKTPLVSTNDELAAPAAATAAPVREPENDKISAEQPLASGKDLVPDQTPAGKAHQSEAAQSATAKVDEDTGEKSAEADDELAQIRKELASSEPAQITGEEPASSEPAHMMGEESESSEPAQTTGEEPESSEPAQTTGDEPESSEPAQTSGDELTKGAGQLESTDKVSPKEAVEPITQGGEAVDQEHPAKVDDEPMDVDDKDEEEPNGKDGNSKINTVTPLEEPAKNENNLADTVETGGDKPDQSSVDSASKDNHPSAQTESCGAESRSETDQNEPGCRSEDEKPEPEKEDKSDASNSDKDASTMNTRGAQSPTADGKQIEGTYKNNETGMDVGRESGGEDEGTSEAAGTDINKGPEEETGDKNKEVGTDVDTKTVEAEKEDKRPEARTDADREHVEDEDKNKEAGTDVEMKESEGDEDKNKAAGTDVDMKETEENENKDKEAGTDKDKKESEDENEEEDGEERVPLLEQPPEMSGRRARKTVDRFSEATAASPETKRSSLPLEQGRGAKLANCPVVSGNIGSCPPEQVHALHQAVFGRQGKPQEFRRNLRQFSGFPFLKDEAGYTKKRDSLLRYRVDALRSLSHLLNLDTKSKGREEMALAVLDFLMEPTPTDTVVESAKKRAARTPTPRKGARSSSRRSAASAAADSSEEEDEDEGEEEEEEEEEEVVKKTSRRKPPAKRTPAKKAPAKKTPAKKAPAKKASAKRASAKKAPAKKAPAKAAGSRKAPSRQASKRKRREEVSASEDEEEEVVAPPVSKRAKTGRAPPRSRR